MTQVKDFDICFVKKEFFELMEKKFGKEEVSEINTKESRRYLCLLININNNMVLIPFESEVPQVEALLKNSIYKLPSETRPKAGLNFEKLLIINDYSYLSVLSNPKIANSQKKEIENNKEAIKEKLVKYIDNYIKACNKNREKREFIFKFSTLHLFKEELGITAK